MIIKSKIFEVYEDKSRNRIYTLNLTPGKRVYDEQLLGRIILSTGNGMLMAAN